MKQALMQGGLDQVIKAGLSTSSSLVWYDLEPVVKELFPVITPLRNYLPRTPGDGGTAMHWKAVTGINTATVNSPFMSEGNRNAYNNTTTASYTANYATIGHDDNVTFEADTAAKNLDDLKKLAVQNLLWSLMIDEDTALWAGNSTTGGVALGTAGTPTLTDVATGGSLSANTTYHVTVVPLTGFGYNLSPAGGVSTYTAVSGDKLAHSNTRTNVDGSTDLNTGYNGQISADATVTTANDGLSTHSIKASLTQVTGAVAYAWFVGTSSGAGSTFAYISTVNSVLIKATGAGTDAANNAAFASDLSQDANAFNGMFSLIMGAGQKDSATSSGAVISNLATGTPGTGTVLTSDTAGGVTQINTILQKAWNQYKIGFDRIWVAAPQLLDLTQLVMAGGGTPLFRFLLDAKAMSPDAARVDGGRVIGQYFNPFGYSGNTLENGGNGKLIPVVLHPTMPPGTIMLTTRNLPYPAGNISEVVKVRERRGYYQIEYPLTTRKYSYGVYAEELVQVQAPFALGMITNISSTN